MYEDFDSDEEMQDEEDLDTDISPELQKLDEDDAADITIESEQEQTSASVKKTKRKKKVVDPFYAFCKTYFSSLIARQSKYVLVNLLKDQPNTLVYMSGRSKLNFGEYVLQYEATDLALQVVTFKEGQLDLFLERTHIEAGSIYLINVTTLLKYLNAYAKIKDTELIPLMMEHTADNILTIQFGENPPKLYGVKYDDWRSIMILQKHIAMLLEAKTAPLGETHHAQALTDWESLDRNTNLILVPVENKQYVTNGQALFPDAAEYTLIVLFDGKDVLSIKEYIKKQKDPYTLQLYTWIVDLQSKYIKALTVYTDDRIEVISARPCNGTYPPLDIEKLKHSKSSSEV